MTFKRTLLAAAVTGAVLATGTAQATNGYFSHGYGVKSMGMAGGGVAFANDNAMVIATNPAGITDVSNQAHGDLSWFKPVRGYDFNTNGLPAGTPGASGSGESDSENFFIPSLGFAYALTSKDSVGLALYGNGGMNTDFASGSGNYLGIGQPEPNGPYGAGEAGVNLEQMFIAPTYARSFMDDRLSVGVSPIIVRQKFKAKGLDGFKPFSTSPENMTGGEHDTSWGYGGKIGVTFKATDRITLGASYQSKMEMDEFDDYSGLFAEGGDFDIPSTWTVGLAADVTDTVTLTFDYQRINYTDVKAISNASTDYLFDPTDPTACNGLGGDKCLGGANGAGFGWDDVDVFKIGAQWQATPKLQLRAGWNRGDNPISSEDVLFNTIAPGVVENHFTAGFSYAFDQNHELHGAFMYAPEVDVDGKNKFLNRQTGLDQDISIYMKQYEATVGYTYKF